MTRSTSANISSCVGGAGGCGWTGQLPEGTRTCAGMCLVGFHKKPGDCFFLFYDADKMSCLLKPHAVEEILSYYWVWTLISQAADEARGGTVPSSEGRQRSR